MSNSCPTVRICGGESKFIVINEEDFDKEIHKLYKEPKKAKKAKKVEQPEKVEEDEKDKKAD